jgi:hypothetical protein
MVLISFVTTHLNDIILFAFGSIEPDYPGGHSSYYYSCISMLNYKVLIGS